MNQTSDDPPLLDRIRSWARASANADASLPITESPNKANANKNGKNALSSNASSGQVNGGLVEEKSRSSGQATTDSSSAEGEKSATVEPKVHVVKRFFLVFKTIMLSSWVNVLLVFVPIGLVMGGLRSAHGDESGISPTIVFAMNCIAIIPLAAMLSYATESVASKLGDTVGALMNVTFGNAVELIIFIIALTKNEIRIVQASLLGSILSNLLLILGMCFLFGGLRFREQLYNANVTQMSACLLSLAVMSLLLPTAFHASFNDTTIADQTVVKVSRGTSVILLLVYVLYLLFQLKSHAFMYESTPQHKIDEESHPGVLADILHSSSSSSDTSSSSDDSDSSVGSHTTAKRIKRALTRRRRRKSSASSKEAPVFHRTPSSSTNPAVEDLSSHRVTSPSNGLEALVSGDEADTETEPRQHVYSNPDITSRDFEAEHHRSGSVSKASTVEKMSRKQKKANKKQRKHEKRALKAAAAEGQSELPQSETTAPGSGPRVGFAPTVEEAPAAESDMPNRRPFLRNISRPALPKVLSQSVFSQANQTGPVPYPANTRTGLRRTSSLPDRLNEQTYAPATNNSNTLPYLLPRNSGINEEETVEGKKHLSKTSAVLLLLISTGLVAVCAEFLVDSIDYIVENSAVSQTFIGLIILPIVGNAAEHVTAVTVATKNKMDLAIGVSIGSSLQIALFVTPFIVLLGWCLDRDMTLYFSLFETVSLFVSAFIVNFLVLDGRSNYLEGALLIAAYIIIGVAAFFYPSCADQNTTSGPSDGGSC